MILWTIAVSTAIATTPVSPTSASYHYATYATNDASPPAIASFREAVEDETPRARPMPPVHMPCALEVRTEELASRAVLEHVADRRVAWFVMKQGARREKKPGRRRLRAWER